MNPAVERLLAHKEEIDRRLSKYFNEKVQHAVTASETIEYVKELAERIKDYNLRGGKRIRPAFVVEGYKAVGGKDLDAIYDAALAAETMEGFLLIHDDVMDRDEVRRGGRTVHSIYRDWYLERIDSSLEEAEHFGNSIAVNAGDIVFTLGYELLATARFDPALKVKAIKRYSTIARYTGYGQVLDLIIEKLPVEQVTEKHVMTVHKFKTSLYTVTGPLQIGVILAGGNEDQLKVMEEYGENVGIAFQVFDDILGMFGDEKKLGKPADSDLKEGKRTLLILKAFERADDEQKQKIKNALGNRNLTPEQLEEVRNIIKETGALDYSKQLCLELVEKGKKALDKADLDPDSKDFLVGIADYMVNREY